MRTAITHFDGDPFVLDFWLKLYDKYWRGEVTKIIADVCYDPETVTEEALIFQKELLAKFPEIEVVWIDKAQVPEISNNNLIPKVADGNILLIESDGFIFGRGIVDACFKKIEEEGFDMVASEYSIIPSELQGAVEARGYMRNFMFIRAKLLHSVAIDFLPQHLNRGIKIAGLTENLDGEYDTDCFGWVALQIAALKPNVFWVPPNYMSRTEKFSTDRYLNYKWVHIRQFNSSVLGFGSPNFKRFKNNDKKNIKHLSNVAKDHDEAQWQFIKAVAFRLIMLDTFQYVDKIPDFYLQYAKVITKVIESCKLPMVEIAELKGYYRGMMMV
jgi:hypothetical protein